MHKLARWAPALAAPVVIVAAAIAIPSIASAEGPLTAKTPAQVLELVAKSGTAAYTGTVSQTSDLGFPDLSAIEGQTGSGGDDLMDLLTASHTAKVYTDGGTKQRLQVLDTLAERDVVRNGTSVWLYDSSQKQAEHLTLPTDSSSKGASPQASAPAVTPAQLAARLIQQLTPSTDFAVSTQDRVAGRSVYRLTLTPKAAGTLVDDATVAVDASTGVPLQVSVYAKGQKKPAVSLAFSSISYGAPAASAFDFTPPKGTSVESQKLAPGTHRGTPNDDLTVKPTVAGTGWDAIAELPAGSVDLSALVGSGVAGGSGGTDSTAPSGSAPGSSGGALPGGQDASVLLALLQPVSGGRGLQTSLASLLITDDGRVLVGAVPLSALEAAAK